MGSRFSCCPVSLGGSFGEDLFIGDGGFQFTAAVAALMVVTVDEPRNLATGLSFGGKVPTRQELPFKGRIETFRYSVIECRPDPSHRLDYPQRVTCFGKGVSGVFASFVAVKPNSA